VYVPAGVAGIDAAEAVRVADGVVDELLEDPYEYDADESLRIVKTPPHVSATQWTPGSAGGCAG